MLVVNRKSLRGFTLVEITLVIAIVTMLFFMAIPNFMEASTRAEVARAKMNLAVLANAVDNYRVDHRMYPMNATANMPSGQTLTVLTTPVQYLVKLPEFKSDWSKDGRDALATYVNYTQLLPANQLYERPMSGGWAAFAVVATGPESAMGLNPNPVTQPLDFETAIPALINYDPTNGTVSPGYLLQYGP